MAPDRGLGRDRSNDFKDLASSGPQDFDPEEDEVSNGLSESGASGGDDDDDIQTNGAREHYADVGKSRLRIPKTAALGAQYRGSRVNRDKVADDEDSDDPFGRGFEEEDSEDETYEGFNIDAGAGSSDEDGQDNDVESGDMDETSDTDLSEDPTEAALKSRSNRMEPNGDRYEVLKSLAKDQKDVASKLAQSTKADAEKGRAVKSQKTAFDSLLGARIKLQKALVGTNTIIGTSSDEVERERAEANDAIERAENAAFNLWSSLHDLREDLIAARAGSKRKRAPFTSTTPVEDLWSHMQQQEESCIPHRNAVLQRWSVKTRSATVQPQHGLLNKTGHQPTIVDALKEHISNPDRLLKRVHTPRSCAPLQLSNNITEDSKIYDDADFYGLLLKELLEQKSQDSAMGTNVDLNFNLHREVKTRKNVDTKASKGRKLRYTVHEKLQNFMAPEDRRKWGDRQAEELFGSLFGQRMHLGEAIDGVDEDQEGGAGDGLDDDETGLILFRS